MQQRNEMKLPPTPILIVGCLAIGVHLFFALLTTLNVPSGPWPVQGGSSTAMAPQFVMTIGNSWVARQYQALIRSNSSFRFGSMRQESRDISFEAQVLNDQGTVTSKISFPDADAPAQVRYRQQRLAEQLDNDEPLPPQQGVIIAAPGEKLPTLRWWQPDGETHFILKQGDPNAVPRNQNFEQPSLSQMVIAKSYLRFISSRHQGLRLALQRNSQDPLMPMVLINNQPPTAEILRRYTWSYGELNQ